MGEILLSKLDIDVIVQVAVLGPLEAETWTSLVDDADAFGAELQGLNWEHFDGDDVGEAPAAYGFEVLSVQVTAAEGLKQLAYFEYNTATDAGDSMWLRSAVPSLLSRLRQDLLVHVGEYRDAPWGWRSGDLAARASRPSPTPPEDSRRLFEVLGIFEEQRLPLQAGAGGPSAKELGDPRLLLGSAHYFPPNTVGFAPLAVSVFATEESAQFGFLLQAHRLKQSPLLRSAVVHVYKFGDVVATFIWREEDPDLAAQFNTAIDQLSRPQNLGAPDDHWSPRSEPERELAADVLASGVRIDPAVASRMTWPHFATIVTTPSAQERLASWIDDADLRSRVTAISTTRQSLILFSGIAEMHGVTSVALRTEVIDHGSGLAKGAQLEVQASSATEKLFTLVAVDRLPSSPLEVRFEAAGLVRTMPAAPPSP